MTRARAALPSPILFGLVLPPHGTSCGTGGDRPRRRPLVWWSRLKGRTTSLLRSREFNSSTEHLPQGIVGRSAAPLCGRTCPSRMPCGAQGWAGDHLDDTSLAPAEFLAYEVGDDQRSISRTEPAF